MHTRIGAFPSEQLYSNKLVPHPLVAGRLLRDLPNIPDSIRSAEEEVDVLETPVTFFDTAGSEYYEKVDGDNDEGSRCNENEGSVVKHWMERLVSCCVLYGHAKVGGTY
jgi:DNA polymerase alpha-associated DNA helicase A